MLEVSPHRIGRSEARVSERAEMYSYWVWWEESSESSDQSPQSPQSPPPNQITELPITRALGLSLSDPFLTTIQARWQRPDRADGSSTEYRLLEAKIAQPTEASLSSPSPRPFRPSPLTYAPQTYEYDSCSFLSPSFPAYLALRLEGYSLPLLSQFTILHE